MTAAGSQAGCLLIVSAPSGAGKTSLVRALLAEDAAVQLSVSHTTRAPRPGEIDGVAYHFTTREAFLARVAHGDFLEHAEVHGNLYGTSHSWVKSQLDAGRDILLEIDWQGAQQVRRLIPDAIGIFVLPPSFDELARRLRGRASDADAVIEARLAAARDEIGHAPEFDYVIINDQFHEAVRDLVGIVRAERLRSARQLARHAGLFNLPPGPRG